MNSVNIYGHLTKDPTVRYNSAGLCSMTFTVAVNERVLVNNVYQDRAHFIGCTLFGNRAKALERKLIKGCAVCINGKLRQQFYEVDGEKKNHIDVVVLDINICKWSNAQSTNVSHTNSVTKGSPHTNQSKPLSQTPTARMPF